MAWITPATRTTGTLIPAAIWNGGVVGNIAWLGNQHDHSGDVGDGATLTLLAGMVGLIGMFDAACPAGWTRVSAFDNKMLMGSATYGTTGGSDTHSHTDPTGHTHTAAHTHGAGTLAAAVASYGGETAYAGAVVAAAYNHTHAMGGTSAAGTVVSGNAALTSDSTLPPYIAVIFCKKDA